MPDQADAVPRATDPTSFGLVAPYPSRCTWNFTQRAARSSRRVSFSGALTVSDMLPGYWAWQHVDMALWTLNRNSTELRH